MNVPIHAPADTIAPINERWPQIFRYGFDLAALSTILAIAVSHVVVLMLLVVGPFLDFVVWAAFFKYCFEALRWTANGRAKPPEISFTVGDQIGVYAVLLLVLIEVLLIFVGMYYGTIAVLGVGILLMLAMPAMVTILALEEGMVRAINPLAWLMLMSRLGNQYFIMAGFFCASVIAQSLLGLGLRTLLPGIVADFIAYCVVNYFMLTTFHVIGNVIYTHRDALGYTGHIELSDEVPHTDPSRKALDAARERASTGDAGVPPPCCATN